MLHLRFRVHRRFFISGICTGFGTASGKHILQRAQVAIHPSVKRTMTSSTHQYHRRGERNQTDIRTSPIQRGLAELPGRTKKVQCGAVPGCARASGRLPTAASHWAASCDSFDFGGRQRPSGSSDQTKHPAHDARASDPAGLARKPAGERRRGGRGWAEVHSWTFAMNVFVALHHRVVFFCPGNAVMSLLLSASCFIRDERAATW